MNWYPRYFGDYMKKTSHLSLAEHGAYVVLLDHYYGTEQPLQADVTALIRVCRAFEQAEQKAVESVCNQFFPIGPDGLRHNKRADAEIAKGRAISGERSSAGIKGAKARKQKHEEEQSKRISNCLTNATANGVSIAATPTPTTTVTPTGTTTTPPTPLGEQMVLVPETAEEKKAKESDMERFYLAYPRKVAVEKFKKAWAVHKHEFPPIEEMLDKLKEQVKTKEWTKDGKAFIPHPATYINQGRYNDVIEKPKKQEWEYT